MLLIDLLGDKVDTGFTEPICIMWPGETFGDLSKKTRDNDEFGIFGSLKE